MALRTEADEDARYPLPGLADLDGLLAEVRAAGLPVRFAVEGQANTLPPGARWRQRRRSRDDRHAGAGHRLRREHRRRAGPRRRMAGTGTPGGIINPIWR